MAIGDEFLRLLQSFEDGLQDSQLKEHFGENQYGGLEPIINELIAANRLQLFTQGDMLVYKLIREETALKFEGLGYDISFHYSFI